MTWPIRLDRGAGPKDPQSFAYTTPFFASIVLIRIFREVDDHDGRSRWDLPGFVLLLLLSNFDPEEKC